MYVLVDVAAAAAVVVVDVHVNGSSCFREQYGQQSILLLFRHRTRLSV